MSWSTPVIPLPICIGVLFSPRILLRPLHLNLQPCHPWLPPPPPHAHHQATTSTTSRIETPFNVPPTDARPGPPNAPLGWLPPPSPPPVKPGCLDAASTHAPPTRLQPPPRMPGCSHPAPRAPRGNSPASTHRRRHNTTSRAHVNCLPHQRPTRQPVALPCCSRRVSPPSCESLPPPRFVLSHQVLSNLQRHDHFSRRTGTGCTIANQSKAFAYWTRLLPIVFHLIHTFAGWKPIYKNPCPIVSSHSRPFSHLGNDVQMLSGIDLV